MSKAEGDLIGDPGEPHPDCVKEVEIQCDPCVKCGAEADAVGLNASCDDPCPSCGHEPVPSHRAYDDSLKRAIDAGAQLVADAKTLGLELTEKPDDKPADIPLVKCRIVMVQTVACDPCPGCGALHASVDPAQVKMAVDGEPIQVQCSCGQLFAAMRSRIISPGSV